MTVLPWALLRHPKGKLAALQPGNPPSGLGIDFRHRKSTHSRHRQICAHTTIAKHLNSLPISAIDRPCGARHLRQNPFQIQYIIREAEEDLRVFTSRGKS